MASSPAAAPPQSVRLPCSSTRLQKPLAHLKLLSAVKSLPSIVLFEGRIFAPGAVIDRAELGEHPVVLECVGYLSPPNQRPREVGFILWRWDQGREQWIEIARAQSATWEWALVLRAPAIAAMTPRPELYDVAERSGDLAGSIVQSMDGLLASEKSDVQLAALSQVYDQVGGRMARVCEMSPGSLDMSQDPPYTARMSKAAQAVDLSSWLTKPQAAAALQVAAKTIERWADDEKIEQRTMPNGRVLFSPADIQRLAAERGISTAVVKARVGKVARIHQVQASAMIGRDETQQLPLSELRHKVFLTTPEAVRYTGLPADYLSSLTSLPRVENLRPYRYRRTDLEKL